MQVCERRHKRVLALRNVAVFPAEIARLASLGVCLVADRSLAADEGIEVGQRGRAVAVFRDGRNVKVIHERTASLGQVRPIDLERNTYTVGIGGGRDDALNVPAIRIGSLEERRFGEGSLVDDAWRVVGNDGGIAELSSGRALGRDGGGGGPSRSCSLRADLRARSSEE